MDHVELEPTDRLQISETRSVLRPADGDVAPGRRTDTTGGIVRFPTLHGSRLSAPAEEPADG